MQHPEITHCEPMPCAGYIQPRHIEKDSEFTLMTSLEALSAQYPYLPVNKPMKLFKISNEEFAEMLNEGYA